MRPSVSTAYWAALVARSERDVDPFHLRAEVAIDHVLDVAFHRSGVAGRWRSELNGDARVTVHRAKGNACINPELRLQGSRCPLRVLQSVLEAKEVRQSAFNGLLGGRLASRPVLWSPLEMGDGDDLDLIWSDLAIDERVGEASNKNPACAVEGAPTLWVL